MNNRLHNISNPHQGKYKRILCVCSSGLLRSPTLALVLGNMGHNARAVGSVPSHALIAIDEYLIEWADQIVFVNEENYNDVASKFDLSDVDTITLAIPDRYPYRDPILMGICEDQYKRATNAD